MNHSKSLFIFMFCALITIPVFGDESSGTYQIKKDIQYAQVNGHKLLLDLYLPIDSKNPPLLIWVHGGAWSRGSKDSMPLKFLVEDGYAIASIDYRLSPVAKFPSQIHDCKAAIRFLRAKEHEYGYDSSKMGIAGSSAGGHLAALMGVTNGHEELEGTVGEYLEESSSIQAVVNYYGPTNFMTILQQSTPHGLSVRVPAFELLLGGRPENHTMLAMLASPVEHVDSQDPPLLILHGDQDPQVPINQSHELHAKYKELNLSVHFEVVYGGEHGGNAFFDEKRQKVVKKFLNSHF